MWVNGYDKQVSERNMGSMVLFMNGMDVGRLVE